MRRLVGTYSFESLRGDLFGGVTAMVVALPVALGFGVASGLGAAAGLYGAIAKESGTHAISVSHGVGRCPQAISK